MRYVLLLLVFIGGCSAILRDYNIYEYETAEALRPQVSSELRMELQAEPLALDRGDTLFIWLKIANDTQFPYHKGFPDGCVFGYGLWNAQGQLVAPPPQWCTQSPVNVTIDPGEEKSLRVAWIWDDPNVESGLYELFAGFGSRGEVEAAPPVEVQLR